MTWGFRSSRLEQDRVVVREKLPRNTREMTVNGVTGWLFEIFSEMGDTYQLFVYFDTSMYQVKVVKPEVEGKYGIHDGHLYPDGRICLSTSGGMPALDQAFSKSVLWATGFSVFLHTGQFPFSRNNYG